MIDQLRKTARRLFSHSLHTKLSRIERNSHGSRATYVGNNRVLVRCTIEKYNVAYYVEADDRLLSPWFIITGKYETELTNYLVRESKQDNNFIDVGSNFGYFTCMMAKLCPKGQVIGIEADHHVYELARDNVAINGFRHARVIHAAASDQSGELTLFRRNTRSGNTSITPADQSFTDSLGELPVESFSVPAVRVDDLQGELGGRLDFMKIDVEGAEPLVISGASETIASNRQISIIMEWSPGQIQAAGFDVADFLVSLADRGLTPFDIDKKRCVSLTFGQLANIPYRAGILLKHN